MPNGRIKNTLKKMKHRPAKPSADNSSPTGQAEFISMNAKYQKVDSDDQNETKEGTLQHSIERILGGDKDGKKSLLLVIAFAVVMRALVS